MTWQTPIFLIPALLLALTCAALLIAKWRPSRKGLILTLAGILLLALAAGTPIFQTHQPGRVMVLVDLSSSTRGATYRDPSILAQQLHRLLPDQPYEIRYFAQNIAYSSLPDTNPLPDLPGNITRYPADEAAGAQAVVLFSDGQFAAPRTAAPVYVIRDPALQRAHDSRVVSIARAGKSRVAATLFIAQPQQTVRFEELHGVPKDTTLSAGLHTLTFTTAIDNADVTVHLLRYIPSSSSPSSSSPDSSSPNSSSITYSSPASPSVPTSSTGHTSITPPSDGQAASHDLSLDLWPENDSLHLPPALTQTAERWFVSNRPAPAGWRHISPAQLSDNPNTLLNTSVLLLDNQPGKAMPAAGTMLQQYVLDMGGQMLIAGGDQSFPTAYHDDASSAIELLSPLASHSNQTLQQWAILVDASGSMNQSDTAGSRWQQATLAARQLLQNIPGSHPVSVGGFSSQVTWWIKREPVTKAIQMSSVLDQASPTGPTHIDAALDAFIALASDPTNTNRVPSSAGKKLPFIALLLTDGKDTLSDPNATTHKLIQAGVRLDVLLLDDGPAGPALERITQQTRGSFSREPNPSRWAAAASSMANRITAGHFNQESALLLVAPPPLSPAQSLPPPIDDHAITGWNQVWLKPHASMIAQFAPAKFAPASASAIYPVAASIWQRGNGRVMALAWSPSTKELDALGRWMERPPFDPRFAIETGDDPLVIVNATDTDGSFINRLKIIASPNGYSYRQRSMDAPLQLTVAGEPHPIQIPLRQAEPGKYVLPANAMDLSRDQDQFITLMLDQQVIGRCLLPARYPQELNNIGLDDQSLAALTKQAGGAIVDLDHPPAIAITHRTINLTWWITAAGAILGMIGLARRLTTRSFGTYPTDPSSDKGPAKSPLTRPTTEAIQ